MRRICVCLLALPLLGAAPVTADLTIKLDRLRNARGLIHACLTAKPAHFPACEKDPGAVTGTAPASVQAIRIAGMAPGKYAVAVVHDENSNRKLDKMMGIPREGFGFSRSPVIRFGPPRFEQVSINVRPGLTQQTVRMQYIL